MENRNARKLFFTVHSVSVTELLWNMLIVIKTMLAKSREVFKANFRL